MDRSDHDNRPAVVILALALLIALLLGAGLLSFVWLRYKLMEVERARMQVIEAHQQAELARQRELQRLQSGADE